MIIWSAWANCMYWAWCVNLHWGESLTLSVDCKIPISCISFEPSHTVHAWVVLAWSPMLFRLGDSSTVLTGLWAISPRGLRDFVLFWLVCEPYHREGWGSWSCFDWSVSHITDRVEGLGPVLTGLWAISPRGLRDLVLFWLVCEPNHREVWGT